MASDGVAAFTGRAQYRTKVGEGMRLDDEKWKWGIAEITRRDDEGTPWEWVTSLFR